MSEDFTLPSVTISDLAPYLDQKNRERINSDGQVTAHEASQVMDSLGDQNDTYNDEDDTIIARKIMTGLITGVTLGQFEDLIRKFRGSGLYPKTHEIPLISPGRPVSLDTPPPSPVPERFMTEEMLFRGFGSGNPGTGFIGAQSPEMVEPEHIRCLETGGKDCPEPVNIPLDDYEK